MKIFIDLFLTFFKIGLFTFGGGYAMIPIIESDCVEKKKWITHDEMMTVTVVAESTPGPVAINCSTYVGYKCAGVPGAICATVGMVLPSFAVIYAVSLFLDNFLSIKAVASAFRGIKICVGILILNAGVKMLRKMKKTAFSVTVAICAFAVMLLSDIFSAKISSVVLLVCAALVGLFLYLLTSSRRKKGGDGQ